MGTFFSTSRAFPKELRAMGHYRNFGNFGADQYSMNTESAIANIFKSLTVGAVDWFGGTSSEAKQMQAEAAAANAQLLGQQAYQEGETKRTLIYVGAGVAAVAILAFMFSGSRRSSVAGYRRRRRRR